MNRWVLGFALRMHTAQFSASVRSAARELGGFTAAHSRLLEGVRSQHAALVRSGVAVIGFFGGMTRLVGAFKRATNVAAEFQYQARALGNVLGLGYGAGEHLYLTFQRLNPHIKEFAPAEVVGRMKELAQAGYSYNEILSSTGAILDAVIAGMGELSMDQAVQLGINLHRAFGTASMDMRALLDIAASAANQFPMTMNQIADAMGYATEAAVQFKQPLEEVLMTIGLLMPVTKTASKAGTAYRNMLKSLTKNVSIQFLEKEGISAKDEHGRMRSAFDIYADLMDRLDELERTDKTKARLLKEQAQQKFGGTRGAAAFAAFERAKYTIKGQRGTVFEGKLFADTRTAVAAMRAGIGGAGNEAKRLADNMRETSKIIEQKFVASLEKAKTAVGSFLLPIRNQFQTWFTHMNEWVSKQLGTVEDPWTGSAGGTSFTGVLVAITGFIAAIGAINMIRLAKQAVLFVNNPGSYVEALRSGQAPGGGGLWAGWTATARRRGSMGAPWTGVRHPRLWSALATGMSGVGRAASLAASAFGVLTPITLGVISAMSYMKAQFSAFADKLYDQGESLVSAEEKRLQLIHKAVEMFTEYRLGNKKVLTQEDMLKISASGYHDIYARVFKDIVERGATPEQALQAETERELSRIRRGVKDSEKREALLTKAEEARKAFIEEYIYPKMLELYGKKDEDKVTLEQFILAQKAGVARPRALGEEDYIAGYGPTGEVTAIMGRIEVAMNNLKAEYGYSAEKAQEILYRRIAMLRGLPTGDISFLEMYRSVKALGGFGGREELKTMMERMLPEGAMPPTPAEFEAQRLIDPRLLTDEARGIVKINGVRMTAPPGDMGTEDQRSAAKTYFEAMVRQGFERAREERENVKNGVVDGMKAIAEEFARQLVEKMWERFKAPAEAQPLTGG